MTYHKPQLNWDRLLDGQTYVLNLDAIGWDRGLSDLRAKIHYEVDRRRGIAHTRKLDALTLQFYAEGARVRPCAGPCSCNAQPWELHVITCTSLGKNAATVIGANRPVLPPVQPNPWAFRDSPASEQDLVGPAPQDQPSTPTHQAEELDDEALLGPCTCGQSPQCLPTCARAGGSYEAA